MSCCVGLDRLAPCPPRSTRVTWGVFDGVHRGHRAVLDEVVAWARQDRAKAVVLTFEPHPQAFLRSLVIPLVVPVGERARLIAATGVDRVIVGRFDRAFADRSAESFVVDLLLRTLGAGGIVIGYDCAFGKGGEGTADLLRRLASARGVEVRCPPPRLHDGAPIKSTRLRDAIVRGDLAAAEALSGRPVAVVGPVVRGDGRGRTLGFPTANLDCRGLVLPPAGVYAAIADHDAAGRAGPSGRRAAVLNIGRRPTFGGDGVTRAEAHLLDFPDVDLYGRSVRAEIVERLREERRFPDAEALRAQIAADCAAARSALMSRVRA